MLIDTHAKHHKGQLAVKPFAMPDALRAVPLKLTLLGRVLILAPHPDDAFFGCGGLIARLRAIGATVELAFVTTTDIAADRTRATAGATRPLRLAHALDAAQRLGLGPELVHVVDFGERNLPGSDHAEFPDLVTLISERTTASDAMTVFVPWHADPHSAHRAINHAAFAVRMAALPKFRLLEYPIWTDARADEAYITQHAKADQGWMVDISMVLEKKQAAVATYGAFDAGADFAQPREYYFEHLG